MVQLSTTSSIVDFLSKQGKPSDYNSRSSLYKESGLEERLGKYVGSAPQNTAFIKQLQTPASTGAIDTKLPEVNPNVAMEAKRFASAPVGTPIKTPIPSEISLSGITAEQARESIPKSLSADEVLNTVLQSPRFQNFQQQKELSKELDIGGAQAEKQKLEIQTAADTKRFVDSIGRRGLFFSGETTTGLQQLAESLASSKLGVDRKLAGQLLQSDLDTKEKIIEQVGQVVKDAQQGRKEAISALEKVGLTVIGDQVVPTLAAIQSEERIALSKEKEQSLEVQRQAQNELSLARLELSQAKSGQQLEMAQARLELAQERADRARDELSAAEKKAEAGVQLYNSTIDAVLLAGLTPQDALDAANKQANTTGLILGVEEQNAILREAQRKLGSGEIKPTPKTVEAPTKGFFSSLFGL